MEHGLYNSIALRSRSVEHYIQADSDLVSRSRSNGFSVRISNLCITRKMNQGAESYS